MGVFVREHGLLDLVYRTPAEPELWSGVIEGLCDRLGGGSGMLSRFSMRDGSGAVTVARIDPTAPDRYFAYYAQRNPLSNVPDPDRYFAGWKPLVLTDRDWMAREDLLASEYYNDFMAPQDMHAVLMIRLGRIGDDVVALSLSRPRRAGDYEPAEVDSARDLHPDLIRAFALRRRIEPLLALDQDMAEVLDASPLALVLLDGEGRARRLNRAAEALVREGALGLANGRLLTPKGEIGGPLGALIARACGRGGSARRGGSMALALAEGTRLAVTVAPLRSERVSLFADAPGVLVCIADPRAAARPPAEILSDLFGLTAAEARVALALIEGEAPRAVAEALALSVNTVRVHMARIFAKTGVSRQSGLVRLITQSAGLSLQ